MKPYPSGNRLKRAGEGLGKQSRTLPRLVVTLGLVCLALSVQAAFDAYLLLAGIPGEATEANHKDWIQVASFAEGQLLPLWATNAQFSDLVFSKSVDKATPLLMQSCAQGDRLANAHLQLLTTGARSLVFYDIQLSNVVVTSDSQTLPAAGSGAPPVETFSLRYDYVAWTYTVLTGAGVPSANVEAYWNLVLNTGGQLVRPFLAITLNPQLSTLMISWLSSSTGWTLQQNTNSVTSLNWSNVTAAIQDDGTNKTIIVNPPTGNRFYRLKQ